MNFILKHKKLIFLGAVALALVVATLGTVIHRVTNKPVSESPVAVFLYHHITEKTDAFDPLLVTTPQKFREDMESMLNGGYVSVTIEDIYNNKKYGTPLPEKSFYVTFDDGYLSNYQYAFPILCELKIHASIFLVEDYEKLDNFFSYEQAREMEQSGYITVYSHSKDHIYHTSVPKNEAITAVSKAIRNIEEKVSNHDIITFAWPYNSYNSALAIDLGNTGVKLQFVQSIIPTKMTDSFLVLRKSVGLDDVAIDIADSFYK